MSTSLAGGLPVCGRIRTTRVIQRSCLVVILSLEATSVRLDVYPQFTDVTHTHTQASDTYPTG